MSIFEILSAQTFNPMFRQQLLKCLVLRAQVEICHNFQFPRQLLLSFSFQIYLLDYDPVSALTDVMRVLASTPADFAALCLEVICSNDIRVMEISYAKSLLIM